MSLLEETTRARQVVYEVRRGRHKPHPHKQIEKKPVIDQQVPLELAPLIRVAMDYGRKTHALGTIQAAKTLGRIADKLKLLSSLHPSLAELCSEAETESQKLLGSFAAVYEEPTD